MKSNEFISYKHQVIFPFLRRKLTLPDRVKLLQEKELWEPQVFLEKKDRHHFFGPLGIGPTLVERKTRGVADYSWTIESLLGLNCKEIQDSLQGRCNYTKQEEHLWYHVNSDALGTPMAYLSKIFSLVGLQEGQKVVDLGSGFGNVGFYIGLQHTANQFIGIEMVGERFLESCRIRDLFKMDNVAFFHEEVGSAKATIPSGEVFFLYDSLGPRNLERVLNELYQQACERRIRIIAVHGVSQLLKHLIQLPWLKVTHALDLWDPQRFVLILESNLRATER